MKKLLIIPLFLFAAIKSYGQKLPWFLDRDTVHKAEPLYVWIFPGHKPIIHGQYIVYPKDIDSLHVYSGNYARKLYGNAAKKGVVIVLCKKDTKIIPLTSLDSVLTVYKIGMNDNRLPVYVDSVLAYPINEIYLELNKIKSVKIDTEFVSDIRFINIITTDPPRKPKPGEIWIRGSYASQ